MSKLSALWDFIGRHKYLITLLVFGVIIVFLDENSLIQRAKHREEIRELRGRPGGPWEPLNLVRPSFFVVLPTRRPGATPNSVSATRCGPGTP